MKKSLRISILTRDNFTCQYCGRKPPEVELHVEHIISRHDGGPDHPTNLVASCTDCNYGKSKRSLHIADFEADTDGLYLTSVLPGKLPPAVPVYARNGRPRNGSHVPYVLAELERVQWGVIRRAWRAESELAIGHGNYVDWCDDHTIPGCFGDDE